VVRFSANHCLDESLPRCRHLEGASGSLGRHMPCRPSPGQALSGAAITSERHPHAPHHFGEHGPVAALTGANKNDQWPRSRVAQCVDLRLDPGALQRVVDPRFLNSLRLENVCSARAENQGCEGMPQFVGLQVAHPGGPRYGFQGVPVETLRIGSALVIQNGCALLAKRRPMRLLRWCSPGETLLFESL